MDTKINNLAAAQASLGKSIAQLSENFRKENAERRTLEITKVYEQKLNELWADFCANHTQIEENKVGNEEHPYFLKNYYQQVRDEYEKLLAKINVRIEETKSAPIVTRTDKGERRQPTSNNPECDSEGVKLRRQLRTVISALERIIDTTEQEIKNPQSSAYYNQKLKTVNQYWEQIVDIYGQLMAEVSDCGQEQTKYGHIEDRFQAVAIRLQERLEEKTAMTSYSANVKLPKITLPVFDGNYTKWKQFKDLFTQLIHNRTMGGSEKMYYLKANLTGEPSRLIKHLQATDDNYVIGWKILLERYDNPRIIVTAILNQFLAQSTLITETSFGIKGLHDTSKECLLALQNMGISIKEWSPILLHLLLQKLDKESRRLYEQSLRSPRELQQIDEFFKFLESRFQMLEAVQTRDGRKKASTLTASTQAVQCPVCKLDHRIFKCSKFLYMTIADRTRLVRKLNLCSNCLKNDHKAKDCPSRGCTKCSKRHNTLIHQEERRNVNTTPRQTTEHLQQNTSPQVQMQNPANTSLKASAGSHIMLATAIVKVISSSGAPVNCRVLLDSGSQLHFICERLVQTLGLKRNKISIPISGIGGLETTAKYETTVTIQSRVNNFSTVINAVILRNISELQPSRYIRTTSWNIPGNIQLADPAFYQPQIVDMLLGAELYLQLLEKGQIKLHDDLPLLQNTHFGWIISGRIQDEINFRPSCHIATLPSGTALEKQLQQFWELEQHDAPSKFKSKEEAECEEKFQNSFQRSSSGRYIVRLPFREQPSSLGSSVEMATKRFYALERKLDKNPDLKRQYVEFMTEYQTLGHMQPIARELVPPNHYYMPHHCVVKADSSTTKLRVVFDASAKTSEGKSLNDILMVGPTVQPDLFSILVNFRIHKYVMTADICKMYRQIEVHPDDRKYQLILWRESKDKRLETFQLNTVTYGTAAAPFLATRCLNQLAFAEYDTFPEAANIILRNTYVDDILTGSNSKQGMLKLKNELTQLLESGGFQLRKFCANSPDILQDVPEEHKEKMLLINENEVTKALGLIWQPVEDTFQYQTGKYESDKITKRTILSDVSRIFDPLGLIGPVTVKGKLILQELWKNKLSWDEELPTDCRNNWTRFKNDLLGLCKLKIPRPALLSNTTDVQLHAFSDSSESAYGACCYVRSMDDGGQIRVRLLCAKSRLAPLKTTTLARLELCAAVLMAELVERVSHEMQIKFSNVTYYTDSTIVLSWIASPSYSWSTFVANRVEKIQQLTQPHQWKHIEGTQNPADKISRGMSPDDLIRSFLWFKGPTFLSEPENNWPKSSFIVPDTIPEAKSKKTVLSVGKKEAQYVDIITSINHSNSFLKLQRIISYCLRFAQNCKSSKELRKTGELSIAELDAGLTGIIKNVQRSAFHKEYLMLRNGTVLDSNQPLQNLAPFLDKDTGIIRVGGRLKHSELGREATNQILLPRINKFSELLFSYLHKTHLHAAPQTLIAIARQRYWVIDARRLARQTVYKCIRCFRCKPRTIDQMMGDLPIERVRPARPFHTTGIDFCGPIMIHYKIRGKTPTKAYVAVFVCFATKAVHLELVSDLSAEAFLNALKRFIARRGLCATIFCDNATNFLGARSHLQELKEMFSSQELLSSLSKLCVQNHIEWKPIPPRSPHFGGLWEAAVKSAKNHLVRQIGNASLTYEELHTVIVQIQAVLNSRPLTPMSSDPNDFEALTPGHFLTGSPLTTFAEPNITEENIDRLTRFQRIQHIQQTFWKRWSTEYLQELQVRNKWKCQKTNLKPGTLVLLRDPNLPPLKWSLGRVIDTFDGPDNLTRVVNVKTATGVLKRSIHSLCPLPEEDNKLHKNSMDYSLTDAEATKQDSSLSNKGTKEGAATSLLGLEKMPTSGQELTASKPPAVKKAMKRPYHPMRGRFLPINPNWKNSEFMGRFKHKRETTESTNSTQTSKGGSTSAVASLKLLMLTSLIMPILGHPTGDPVEITPFPSHPGIFFEQIGHTSLINSEWKVIAYYKLENYWNELIGIRTCVEAIEMLCNTTILKKNHCLEVLYHFQNQLIQIEEANELLHKRSSNNKIHKRSPLDIVGNIANKLFGVLDSSYAKHVEEEIEKTRQNENYLMQLLKNQTSVLETTANVIKGRKDAIQQQFKAIHEHIVAFSKYIDNVQMDLQATQAFTALTALTTIVLQNYIRMQGILLDVMTDIQHNKINPLLITPTQLRNQLALIKHHLPSSLTIPGYEKDDGLLLYHLMTAGVRATKSYIIFDIRVPLALDEYFQLFKLIPVPIPKEDKFIFIKPSTGHLIINLPREKYYPLTQSELDKCKQLDEDHFLCSQTHPIFNSKANISQCELDLLNHQKGLSPTCQLRTSNRSKLWIQLHTPNNWLYCLDTETTFNIVCGTTVTLKTLQGSGILRLRPDCSIKQTTMTITGHGRYQSKLLSSFIPDVNFSEFLKSNTIHKKQAHIYPEFHLKPDDHEIDTLTTKIKDLKESEILHQGIRSHDIHHYTISYLLLFAVLIGCSYYIVLKCQTTNKNNQTTCSTYAVPPVPARRTHINVNDNFVLHSNPRGQDDQANTN